MTQRVAGCSAWLLVVAYAAMRVSDVGYSQVVLSGAIVMAGVWVMLAARRPAKPG